MYNSAQVRDVDGFVGRRVEHDSKVLAAILDRRRGRGDHLPPLLAEEVRERDMFGDWQEQCRLICVCLRDGLVENGLQELLRHLRWKALPHVPGIIWNRQSEPRIDLSVRLPGPKITTGIFLIRRLCKVARDRNLDHIVQVSVVVAALGLIRRTHPISIHYKFILIDAWR